MPTGRHLGHRAPSIADKARIARANRTAADLAPSGRELRLCLIIQNGNKIDDPITGIVCLSF
jgi:hypothetical protein